MCFVYIFRKQIACRCVLFEYWIYLKLISKQSNQTPHPIFYINSDHRTKLQKQICWQFLNIIWILCRKAHFRPRHINQTTPFWFWETTMSAPHHHHRHRHHQLQTLSQFHPFIHLSYLFCRGVGKSLSCYVAFSLIKCCWKLSTFPWCYPSPCVLLLVPLFMVLRKQQRFSSIWVSANWMNDKKSFINNPVDTKKFQISSPFSALGFSTIYNASWCYPEYVHICWARADDLRSHSQSIAYFSCGHLRWAKEKLFKILQYLRKSCLGFQTYITLQESLNPQDTKGSVMDILVLQIYEVSCRRTRHSKSRYNK